MNGIVDVLKLQVVSRVMHPGAGGGAAGAAELSLYALAVQCLVMVLVGCLDDLIKALPRLVDAVKTYVAGRVSDGVQAVAAAAPDLRDACVPLDTRHHINSLDMTRTYAAADGKAKADDPREAETNAMVDSVLALVSQLHNVPRFALVGGGQVMATYRDKPVQLTRDVFCRIQSISEASGGGGHPVAVRLSLLSNTKSAAELAVFVRGVHAARQLELKNSLGDAIYFFDQKTKDGGPPRLRGAPGSDEDLNHRRALIATAPRALDFVMTPFWSNKRFDNVFGEDCRRIKDRVRFFLDNRDWYDRKGVPYQLGILLAGTPGTGKTSIIRAIANHSRRHIVNVNFSQITTATQLKNLFYSDKLSVPGDGGESRQYHIPVDQRLYVLEEIDAVGDVVRRRDARAAAPRAPLPDELTLADVLTVLDGTMEIPGRILVMTTNHPELLDPALVRPGRVDVQVRFGPADRGQVLEMYAAYLDAPVPPRLVDDVPDRVLTAAEVSQVLFRHFTVGGGVDHAAAVGDLAATAQARIEDLARAAPPEPLDGSAATDDEPSVGGSSTDGSSTDGPAVRAAVGVGAGVGGTSARDILGAGILDPSRPPWDQPSVQYIVGQQRRNDPQGLPGARAKEADPSAPSDLSATGVEALLRTSPFFGPDADCAFPGDGRWNTFDERQDDPHLRPASFDREWAKPGNPAPAGGVGAHSFATGSSPDGPVSAGSATDDFGGHRPRDFGRAPDAYGPPWGMDELHATAMRRDDNAAFFRGLARQPVDAPAPRTDPNPGDPVPAGSFAMGVDMGASPDGLSNSPWVSVRPRGPPPPPGPAGAGDGSPAAAATAAPWSG